MSISTEKKVNRASSTAALILFKSVFHQIVDFIDGKLSIEHEGEYYLLSIVQKTFWKRKLLW